MVGFNGDPEEGEPIPTRFENGKYRATLPLRGKLMDVVYEMSMRGDYDFEWRVVNDRIEIFGDDRSRVREASMDALGQGNRKDE